MKRAIAAITVFIVVSASSSRAAHAGQAESLTQAREHYEKGTTAYDLGRYLEAAHEYETAYEIRNDPALLFNIAQAYRLGQDKASALRAYRSYLRRVPDAPNRAEVTAKIAELQNAAAAPAQKQPATEPQPPKIIVVPIAPPAPASDTRSANEVAAAAAVTTTAPVHRPLYQRWWFWTATAVAVGAVGAGIAVGLTESRKSEPVAGTVRFP